MYLFIWLQQVLVAAHGIFSCGVWTLSCSLWDLVPWPGIKPVPPALGVQSLSHWITRQVTVVFGCSDHEGLLVFFCFFAKFPIYPPLYPPIYPLHKSASELWESVSQPQCVCWINPNSQLLGCESFSVDITHNRFLLRSFSHNADP